MRARPGGRSDRGFVLVAVLALLVILSLLAGAVALASQRAVAEAQAELDRFDGELDAVSTRETLLFMLATQRMNIGGLTTDATGKAPVRSEDEDADGTAVLPHGNEIRLDGTVYRGVGTTLFSLQDSRGLLSPNWASALLRHRLYESLGARQQDWNGLDAKRLDYQDPDSLHRLGGAEAPDYEKAGLPPPSNRPIVSPLEYRRILGWNELLEGLDDDELVSLLGVDRVAVLNVNTAPARVLALLPGMDQDMAERMVALRRQAPFVSLATLRANFPLGSSEDDAVTLFPNPSGNLILWDSRQGTRVLSHWTLTPWDEQGRPWRINYEVILPRGKQPDPGVVQSPAIPLFPAQDPAG